jgi:hypothetical protein
MAPSQPVAGEEIEASRGKEAEADRQKHEIHHYQSPREVTSASATTPTCIAPNFRKDRCIRI